MKHHFIDEKFLQMNNDDEQALTSYKKSYKVHCKRYAIISFLMKYGHSLNMCSDEDGGSSEKKNWMNVYSAYQYYSEVLTNIQLPKNQKEVGQSA
jgi:hypothetical protein